MGFLGLSIREYFSGPPQAPLTAAQYVAGVKILGEGIPLPSSCYPLANYGAIRFGLDRVNSDQINAVPSTSFNQQAATNAGQRNIRL